MFTAVPNASVALRFFLLPSKVKSKGLVESRFAASIFSPNAVAKMTNELGVHVCVCVHR